MFFLRQKESYLYRYQLQIPFILQQLKTDIQMYMYPYFLGKKSMSDKIDFSPVSNAIPRLIQIFKIENQFFYVFKTFDNKLKTQRTKKIYL